MCLSSQEFNDAFETIFPKVRSVCKTYKGFDQYFEDSWQQACVAALVKGSTAFETTHKLQMYLATKTHGYMANAARDERRRFQLEHTM